MIRNKFLGAFLNHLFPQELRKTKAKEFVDLKKRNISVKEYDLRF